MDGQMTKNYLGMVDAFILRALASLTPEERSQIDIEFNKVWR